MQTDFFAKNLNFDITVSQITTTWQALWSNYKEFSRKEKTVTSGSAQAKKLDPEKKMLMEKMRYFEPFVVDVFSNVMTTSGVTKKTTSSIWKAQEQPCQANVTNRRKVPQPSKNFTAREDRKEKMFKLVEGLAEKISNVTNQSEELINKEKGNIVSSSTSTSPEEQTRKALLAVVDKYFVNLTEVERSHCLSDMLEAMTGD